ncbi:40S ribosomal protein S23 [Galemys pyrenaicus]|uniref:Small ribosomal subunit protein uS12 n=1 Tax=Galemys pyrenaicus TaxID=202257 RepID=A0A8J6A0Y5_GALPY|nr:40S ribosomal protein S23 [Galemys pyrenaicus]
MINRIRKSVKILSSKPILLEKLPMQKGKRCIEAKQPNSAILKREKKHHITAFVPNDGCLNFIEENDQVLVAGFGCKDHALGNSPGV